MRHAAQLFWNGTLLVAMLVVISTSGNAATLYGKVVQITDGDTFTIFNLNRPVTVRLLAVDSPDGVQAFADVARQHLASLILHQSVTVEYSGLGQNNYLIGKVFRREVDIGAQMLRDGVAWFDPSTAGKLSDTDRQIYLQCEQAARAEHRGLWQDSTAIAPWEFKQRQTAGSQQVPRSPNQRLSTSGSKPKKALGSEDLVQAFTGPGSAVSVSSSTFSLNSDENSAWRILAPQADHFSVQVPGVGYEYLRQIPAGTEIASVNCWFIDFEHSTFLVMWMRGPNMGATDSLALEQMAKGLAIGLNRGFERRGLDQVFDAKQQRNLKLDGYSGIQFSLSSSRVPGVMRAFSKQIGEQRELYVVAVLNKSEEDPAVNRFFKSLSLVRKTRP